MAFTRESLTSLLPLKVWFSFSTAGLAQSVEWVWPAVRTFLMTCPSARESFNRSTICVAFPFKQTGVDIVKRTPLLNGGSFRA